MVLPNEIDRLFVGEELLNRLSILLASELIEGVLDNSRDYTQRYMLSVSSQGQQSDTHN